MLHSGSPKLTFSTGRTITVLLPTLQNSLQIRNKVPETSITTFPGNLQHAHDMPIGKILNPVCFAQLRVKIAKQQAAKEQKLRKKNLTKYIPNAAYAIYRVLQSMSETPAVSPHTYCRKSKEKIVLCLNPKADASAKLDLLDKG